MARCSGSLNRLSLRSEPGREQQWRCQCQPRPENGPAFSTYTSGLGSYSTYVRQPCTRPISCCRRSLIGSTHNSSCKPLRRRAEPKTSAWRCQASYTSGSHVLLHRCRLLLGPAPLLKLPLELDVVSKGNKEPSREKTTGGGDHIS